MAKKGKKKKFPDLTGDGKVTRADILKGRGVIESDDFIDEVMSRVEENILLEEEHIQNVLAEAEENGIDVDYLTEEELSELFGLPGFGMDTSTSRSRTGRARMGAPKGSRRGTRAAGRIARKERRKSSRAAMMDRLAKVSAERKAAKAKTADGKPAAKKTATQTTDKKDPATGTTLTKGEAAPKRFTPMVSRQGKVDARGRRKPLLRKVDSTDIVRGARLALAEKVVAEMYGGTIGTKTKAERDAAYKLRKSSAKAAKKLKDKQFQDFLDSRVHDNNPKLRTGYGGTGRFKPGVKARLGIPKNKR